MLTTIAPFAARVYDLAARMCANAPASYAPATATSELERRTPFQRPLEQQRRGLSDALMLAGIVLTVTVAGLAVDSRLPGIARAGRPDSAPVAVPPSQRYEQ